MYVSTDNVAVMVYDIIKAVVGDSIATMDRKEYDRMTKDAYSIVERSMGITMNDGEDRLYDVQPIDDGTRGEE